jgi:hypothetical protein
MYAIISSEVSYTNYNNEVPPDMQAVATAYGARITGGGFHLQQATATAVYDHDWLVPEAQADDMVTALVAGGYPAEIVAHALDENGSNVASEDAVTYTFLRGSVGEYGTVESSTGERYEVLHPAISENIPEVNGLLADGQRYFTGYYADATDDAGKKYHVVWGFGLIKGEEGSEYDLPWEDHVVTVEPVE